MVFKLKYTLEKVLPGVSLSTPLFIEFPLVIIPSYASFMQRERFSSTSWRKYRLDLKAVAFLPSCVV